MVKLATVAMEAKANVKYLNFNHLDLFSPNSITFTEKPLYAKQVFQFKRQQKRDGNQNVESSNFHNFEIFVLPNHEKA